VTGSIRGAAAAGVVAAAIGMGASHPIGAAVAQADAAQPLAVAAQESVVVRVEDQHLTWFVRRPAGAGWATHSFVYGLANEAPLWGDWDGNGTLTPGVVRGTVWHLRNGAGGGNADVPAFGYGQAGDRPVVGDWDGNGTFTPGVVRGTVWHLRDSNSAGAASVPAFGYGQAGDRPVVGDWDGNGTWTVGVVRDNVWHLRNSNGGGDADGQFAYGTPTDTAMHSGVPAPAPVVRPIDWSRFTEPAPADSDAQRLAAILRNTNRYAMVTWWSAQGYQAQTGAYLDFQGTGEYEIRAPANEAFALATSLRLGTYDPAVAAVSASEARARSVKLARSLALRHLINSDGGWGAHWQSALWAAHAAFAAWLLWEDLAPADRDQVARMVQFEADRLNDYQVPYYRDRAGTIVSPGDTKAEENAWNAMILQVATAMMPNHPRYESWLVKAIELEISAYARPADLTNTTVVNGRPVNQWLNGSNANNDGFVINHGFVHPDYSTNVSLNVHAALAHPMAGQPTPRAALWNADIVYDALVDHQWVAGSTYPPRGPVNPPGGTVYVDGSEHIYYPQGNDWGTDRRIQPTLLDVQAHGFGFDQLASQKGDYWQRLHGQRVLDMQLRAADRRTYQAAGEDTYRGREELVASIAAQAYLTRWILAQNAFQLTNQPVTS
jgi:hypothetical protein